MKQLDWNCKNVVNREDVKELSDTIQGVYILENVNKIVFYVGKTEKQSIQKRMDQHYGTEEKNEIIINELENNWPINVYFAEVDDSDIPGIEQYLKDYFQPTGNDINPSATESLECNVPLELEEVFVLNHYFR